MACYIVTMRYATRRNNNMKGWLIMRTISIKEIQESAVSTYSVKDSSVRGIATVSKGNVKIGDKVVIDNYFHLVTE